MVYHQTRRIFIKKITSIGIVLQMPSWISCTSTMNHKLNNLDIGQQQIISSVMQILFPDRDTIGIYEFNSIQHLDNYLSDTNIDNGDKSFIIEGIERLNKIAINKFHADFTILTLEQQEKVIEMIYYKNWGEYWLSNILTIIFESMLLDPIYRVNIDKKGWEWLDYKSGVPRPTLKNNYKKLLSRKGEDLTINSLSQL